MLNMSIHDVNSNEIQHRGGIPPFLQARKELEAATGMSAAEKRAIAVVCALNLVLHHHGCPETVIESLRSQIMECLALVGESTFVKRAKYLLCAPFSKYLKAEMPPRPEGPDGLFEPRGEWKRWMKSRMCLNTQNTHLWYSYLQAKRGALPLSEGMVDETYEKHFKAMGVEDPIDEPTFALVMAQLKPVLDFIRTQMMALYRDTEITMEAESQHTASTRACFEQTRKNGGAIKFLQEQAGVRRFNPENCVVDRAIPDLVRMSYHPLAVVNGKFVRDYVHEEYAYLEGESLWKSYFANKLPHIQNGRVNCTIQAVLEPLKVRVISKGEAVPYYVSKPLQKALHTAMRRMPAFRLIGKPLEESDLTGLIRNGAAGGSGPLQWFSIDYSAATDGLSARLSSAIMTDLVRDFPVELQNVFKRVLAPHHCNYPGGVMPDIDQVNGQLMGSILSFPVLCIANLGLYLAVTADDDRDIHARMRGVLVNGDDMLYCARESRWQTHVDLGKKVGLEMSVGKAYHHSTVANANSMCFHYEIGKVGAVPRHVPYLNAGLFFGQGKVQGGTDENVGRSKSSVITELVRGMRPSKAKELLGFYLTYHKTDLKEECESYCGNAVITRNLFLPESVGGLGQLAPSDFRFRITGQQRQLATTLYSAQPSAWFADGVHFQKVTGRTQYDPVDDVTFDSSIRAPWLAPKRSTVCKFPKLDSQRMPKRLCRIGFVVTRTLRPTGCCYTAARRSTPTETWWRDYRDHCIEKDFRHMERVSLTAYAIADNFRGARKLEHAAFKSMWSKVKNDVQGTTFDPFYDEFYGKAFGGQASASERMETVALWNRRYGSICGGAYLLDEGWVRKVWSALSQPL